MATHESQERTQEARQLAAPGRQADRLSADLSTHIVPDKPRIGRPLLTEPTGIWALLRSRQFGPLFATQFLSAFNDNALKNALVLMITYRPELPGQVSAGLLVPLAGGLFIAPFFFGSATAGELADAFDKARLIRLVKSIEIAVMVAAAAAVVAGDIFLLLMLLLAMGIAATFFGPLKYAVLPDLLRSDQLLLGNALIETGTFLAILLGNIAGILIATTRGATAVATLITLVAVAAFAFSWLVPAIPVAAERPKISKNFLAATMRLIGEAKREKTLFWSVLGISWFWLVGTTFVSIMPTFIRYDLSCEEAVITVFLTVFTVGIGIGSFLCNRILHGEINGWIVPWGALGIGLFSIDLWLGSPANTGSATAATLNSVGAFLSVLGSWRILGDLLGISVSGGVFVLPLYTLLQTVGDPLWRARMVGANNVINAAAMVLSALAVMALIAVGVSVPGLFLLTGIATLGVTARLWRIRRTLRVVPTASADKTG